MILACPRRFACHFPDAAPPNFAALRLPKSEIVGPYDSMSNKERILIFGAIHQSAAFTLAPFTNGGTMRLPTQGNARSADFDISGLPS
jgi:hypothetical protein